MTTNRFNFVINVSSDSIAWIIIRTILMVFLVKYLVQFIQKKRLKKRFDGKMLRVAAYHEAGHALICHLNNIELRDVKIGIQKVVQTEDGLGIFYGSVNHGPIQVKARTYISVLFAGMAAEKIFLGDVSADGEVNKAIELAKTAVSAEAIDYQEVDTPDFSSFFTLHQGENASESAKEQFEARVNSLLSSLYTGVLRDLIANKPAIEALAEKLTQKRSLKKAEVLAVFEQFKVKTAN